MTETTNEISQRTKKVLDTLREYGYSWDYNNCRIVRYFNKFHSYIRRFYIDGTYGIYKTDFSLSRYTDGQMYSIGVEYNSMRFITLNKLRTLDSVCKSLVDISDLLNKIKNREIVSYKYFIRNSAKYIILSCKDNTHLLFVKPTSGCRSPEYRFILEEQTKDFQNWINKIKLISRL